MSNGDHGNEREQTREQTNERVTPDAPPQLPQNHRIPNDSHTSTDDAMDELERQAREMLQAMRQSAGNLGTRVRQALDHASSLWDEAHPGLPVRRDIVTTEDEHHARSLARGWARRDFLVDPELASAMSVHAVTRAQVWRVELRERGESRTFGVAHEPYRGQFVGQPAQPQSPWDYSFPATPDIASGERREHITGAETLDSCQTCNGAGHRACVRCEGRGRTQCPVCHGRAKIPCPRCKGRGRIASQRFASDPAQTKSQIRPSSDRLGDFGGKVADFARWLRTDTTQTPPAFAWATPTNAADTIPCPECEDGTRPCGCSGGQVPCERCSGAGAMPCAACSGTGKVLRYQTVIRRFDTQMTEQTLPYDQSEVAEWIAPEMLRRATSEPVWEGAFDTLTGSVSANVPAEVWSQLRAFADRTTTDTSARSSQPDATSSAGERRVIARQLTLTRVPVTRVEYEFAGKPFEFIAVGGTDAERFWAQRFPPRWSRVGRFLKALSRDLQNEGGSLSRADSPTSNPNGEPTSLTDYLARRDQLRPPDATPPDEQ
ncbi:MAG: hypothetical protein OJF49_003812 [Ktedonobacterales bacterium]|nr:MAG: hypothetical protein OJF49_003812 [Ktedonobacterales bacterium]